MSIRRNSLQSVFIDSISLLFLMGGVAIAMAAYAKGAEPQNPVEHDILSDRRLTDDHIDSQLNTDDNMPSGSQEESLADKRNAMMLGMKLFEKAKGNISVKDVTAASPAWDAGIRPGDRLLSIDGIEPKALSAWVEDLGKILRDTPDGHAVSARIDRDGEELEFRVRVPVSNVAAARDARQEEQAQAKIAAEQEQTMQQAGPNGSQAIPGENPAGGYGPGAGYGGVAGYGIDSGFFADEGGNQTGDDRMARNAVAQLMQTSTVDSQMANGTDNLGGNLGGGNLNRTQMRERAASGAATGINGSIQTNPGGQIGMAAFHDTGQAVNAMVVVRGLPQGQYVVGISQGSGGAGFGGTGVNGAGVGFDGNLDPRQDPANQQMQNANRRGGLENEQLRNSQNPNATRPIPGAQLPGVQPGAGNQAAPGGATGGGGNIAPRAGGNPGAGGGGSTQGTGGEGASLANPRSPALLAQQIDPAQNSPNGQPGLDQPATDVQREAANSQQLSNDARRNRSVTSLDGERDPSLDPNQDGAGMPHMLAQLGTLQIGPDGSGRLNNQLDGMSVANLAGLNVIVVTNRTQRGFAQNPNAASAPQDRFQQNNQAQYQPVGPQTVASGVIELVQGNNLPGGGVGQDELGQPLPNGQSQPQNDPARNQRGQNRATGQNQGF